MKEPKINTAHYTQLFMNVNSVKLNIIISLFNIGFNAVLDAETTLDDVPNLYEMFYAKYRFYEINDVDENIFVISVQDTFNQHKDYYIQLARAYYKMFDFTTANKRRVQREDSGTTQVNTSTESEGNTENDTYGLPNKQVNTLKDGYLTNVEKGSSHDAADSTREGTTSLVSDVVTTYDNEYLDLKRQYVRQLRNLMLEFVDKFEDCFLHVYS